MAVPNVNGEASFSYSPAVEIADKSNDKVDLVVGSSRVLKDLQLLTQQTTIVNEEKFDNTAGVNITANEFQDLLTSKKDKWEAPVKPVLLMTGGLPKSGKSRAIRQLLKLQDQSKKHRFKCYNMISVNHKFFKANDSATHHHFGFLAGVKTNFNTLEKKVSGFIEDGSSAKVDADIKLKEHRQGLGYSWDELKEISLEEPIAKYFHSNPLGKGVGLIKIWDIGFDSFSSQFLHCFSGHFYNSYMWLFTDIERDQLNLHLPPSKEETTQPVRRSRIQYLLNPSKLSSKLKCERERVCTIFATHTSVLYEKQIREFRTECESAVPQLGCSKLIKNEVIPISFAMLNKQPFMNELHQIISKAPQGIPLSHLFLRGSLELEPSVFMRREELKRKARLCGIDDDQSFDEFCKSFTSFGSIIDVGLVSNSDIIIVKPDEFLTTLDQAFNFESKKVANGSFLTAQELVARDGILTSDVALSLLGKEYQLFLEVLQAVGLATSVAGGQCQPPQDSSQCYYMPSLRQHEEEKYFSKDAVQMIRTKRYSSINMEVALTKYLLEHLPNPKLLLTGKKNVTIITSSVGDVTITYHGEVIEFLVSPDLNASVIKVIIEACKGIPSKLKDRIGEKKFQFAVLCLKHEDSFVGYSFNRKHHVLPIELDCKICHSFTKMQLWSSQIKEVGIQEEFKLNGSITAENIAKLATEISKYPPDIIQAYRRKLNEEKNLSNNKSNFVYEIMETIISWVKQYQGEESTKKKMAIILIELHMDYNKDIIEKKLNLKFKQLARELDIQTLTNKQKEDLFTIDKI